MNWRKQAEAAGISEEEYHRLLKILEREPNLMELKMVGAMWSEHCSYKSSSHLLKTLPTSSKVDSERVVCGPGENAGAVSIGDGQLLVFKVESHNHPSYIDPEQGASTGVGGILRDIFTMGARPVALMNGLFFGELDRPETHYLFKGVVKGIGGYGNCIGIPTIGGVSFFHRGYEKNILVNVMAVGLSKKLFSSKGEGVGNLLLYAGNLTGTDGIHGARMSSSPLKEGKNGDSDPIQVADPFVGKEIMESSLELMKAGIVVALQDMGAAGITCSTVEIANKGGYGVEMDLDQVPQRGTNLTSKEILLSESQERMLFVVRPEDLPQAQKVLEKWGVYYGVIGKLTDSKNMTVYHKGDKIVELPMRVFEEVPLQERQRHKLTSPRPVKIQTSKNLQSLEKSLRKIISSPNFCSKDWIYQQYDQTIGGNTLKSDSSSLSIVRVGKDKAVAMSMSAPFMYCTADPQHGARIGVAECWRKLISLGSKPLAITNCLNFGDPRGPETMESFALAVKGIGEACDGLDFPVVSGNVSLYNQTGEKPIPPTPVVGGVGLVKPLTNTVSSYLQQEGNDLVLVGETGGHLARSAYAMICLEEEGGHVPPLDLETEKKNGEFVLSIDSLISCRALVQGGLIIALLDMCLKNRLGVKFEGHTLDFEFLFGEDQSRYLVETDRVEDLIEAAAKNSTPARKIGKVIGQFEIQLQGTSISLEKMLTAWKGTIPKCLAI